MRGPRIHSSLLEPLDHPSPVLDEKECPYCFETIKARAIVCRFCGRNLESQPSLAAGTRSVEHEDLFGMLLSLSDKSLVTIERADSSRFRLLETVRQYLREKLLHTEEAATIRDRHLVLFTEFAERQAEGEFGPTMSAVYSRLDAEQDNLRAALNWSLERPGHLEEGLRLCVALSRYWVARGLLAEGRDWSTRLAERCEGQPQSVLLAQTLLIAGASALSQSGNQAARALLDRALAMSLELGDSRVLAAAYHHFGNFSVAENRFEAAENYYRQAAAIRRELGLRPHLIATLNNLGSLLSILGREDEARATLEECMNLAIEIDDIRLASSAMANLAGMDASRGDWDTVIPRLETALEAYRGVGDKWGTAALLSSIGALFRVLGRLDEAEPILQEALELNRELQVTGAQASNLNNLAALTRFRGDLARAWALNQESLRLRLARGDDGETVLSIEEAACLFAREGEPERAVRILSACEHLRTQLGLPISPLEAKVLESEIAQIRTQLSAEAFEESWSAGSKLSFGDVCRLAAEPPGRPA